MQEKAFGNIPYSLYKNSQWNGHKGNVPQHYKGHIWQAHQ